VDAEEAVAYRIPLRVTERVRYKDGSVWPCCPRCIIPLEREYQAFCDRCGQALDWRGLRYTIVRNAQGNTTS